MSSGITAFDIHAASGTILYSLAGSLWRLTLGSGPEEMKAPTAGTRLDAKLCPADPNVVAFVRDGNLWAARASPAAGDTCKEWRLSGSAPASDPVVGVSAGAPPYVVQEEFDRYTGHWWQPANAVAGVHHVLFEQVDERHVDEHFIPSYLEKGGDTFRFPRVGTRNPSVELRVAELDLRGGRGGGDGEAEPEAEGTVRQLRLPFPLRELFPWHEYLVRAGWYDHATVWVQLLDRAQSRLELVLLPLAAFCAEPAEPLVAEAALAEAFAAAHFHVLRTEVAPPDEWINLSESLTFLPSSAAAPHTVNFLWTSEATGFRHVQLCSSTKAPGATDVPVRTCVALTRGPWAVDPDEISTATRDNGLHVFFTARKDSPLERHLYHICLSTAAEVSEPTRLTAAGFSHSTVVLSPDCQSFVSTFSSLNEAPASSYCRLNLDELGSAPLTAVLYRAPATAGAADGWGAPPRLVEYVDSHGERLYGLVYDPRLQGWAGSATSFPALVYVYGGPHVQLVTNEYKAPRFLRLNLLARLGFCVVVLDCRGSYNRGIQFEKHLRNAMGTFEIAAQVEGLQHVMASGICPIDPARVGIFGWSYGGYLALMGLAQRPDFFKVAVSGAPVSCWEAYDTAYTERYMALGATNAYDRGSVLKLAESFPDEFVGPNRLLLVHGLIDENVHFQHTALLVDALVNACKPYELQVYPSERHGFRGHAAAKHFEVKLWHFLLKNL